MRAENSSTNSASSSSSVTGPTGLVKKPEILFDESLQVQFKADFYQKFITLNPPLGKGTFSIVYRARERESGKEYAAKILHREVSPTFRNFLKREINIMLTLDHPNIVKLYDVYEEKNLIILLFELVQGEELFQRVIKKKRYKEEEAKVVVRQLASVASYLHQRNIVHRDLKLENVMTFYEDGVERIKVIDFGLSKKYAGGEDLLKSRVGSPTYCAPEIYKLTPGGTYTSAVDIWSIGVITYTLLSGYPPFGNGSDPAIAHRVTNLTYSFNDAVWNQISPQAKDFLNHIFVLDISKRYSADDCLRSPWISSLGNFALDSSTSLASDPNIILNPEKAKKNSPKATLGACFPHSIHSSSTPSLPPTPATVPQLSSSTPEVNRNLERGSVMTTFFRQIGTTFHSIFSPFRYLFSILLPRRKSPTQNNQNKQNKQSKQTQNQNNQTHRL